MRALNVWVALVLAVGACHGQLASLGGDDGGMRLPDGRVVGGDVCKGIGATRPALPATSGALQSCEDSSQCTKPDVCVKFPGAGAPVAVDAGKKEDAGFCGPACESDCDCPAWMTCRSGLCSECGGLFVEGTPSVQCSGSDTCQPYFQAFPGTCRSNADCPIGSYCGGGRCAPHTGCVACLSDCVACDQNSQCQPGQVCDKGKCATCTSDEQCGPAAKCQVTHVGTQCTCASDTDCQSGTICYEGLCTIEVDSGSWNGGECLPCGSFFDCNGGRNPRQTPPPAGFGLACIAGACTACTANSQCGGGEACVAGTCGTCAADSQCGASGRCYYGYCVCTSDAQCDTGQRCGAGVCVEE
jgi:hypothetical protein